VSEEGVSNQSKRRRGKSGLTSWNWVIPPLSKVEMEKGGEKRGSATDQIRGLEKGGGSQPRRGEVGASAKRPILSQL